MLTAAITADAPGDQLRRGCQAFLEGCLEPRTAKIVLIDGPRVLGWSKWRELDEQRFLALIRGALDTIDPARDNDMRAHLLLGAMDEAALVIATAPDSVLAFSVMRCSIFRMTTQLAIRLDDADLAALDELAAAEGVSRSEAARQAIRHRAGDTAALRNLQAQRRVDALLGVPPNTEWPTSADVLAHRADPQLAGDLADAIGDESTDDMVDPWIATK